MAEDRDEIISHTVSTGECGHSLHTIAPKHVMRKQVFETPVTELNVIEHQAEIKRAKKKQNVSVTLSTRLPGSALPERCPVSNVANTNVRMSENTILRTYTVSGGYFQAADCHLQAGFFQIWHP